MKRQRGDVVVRREPGGLVSVEYTGTGQALRFIGERAEVERLLTVEGVQGVAHLQELVKAGLVGYPKVKGVYKPT